MHGEEVDGRVEGRDKSWWTRVVYTERKRGVWKRYGYTFWRS